MVKSALDYAREALDAISPSPTDSSHANDDELFDAFIALLNQGNEEMAVMVYAGILPIPEHLTDD
jgi:hypothetical protein